MTFYSLPLTASRSTTAVRREMDRLFDDLFAGRPANGWQPPVDAREDASGYTIDMDLPGVSPESVEVLAEDGVLTIRGARPAREGTETERVVFAERVQGGFVRRFRLPKAADLQAVTASYVHGVLQVRIAKIEPAQPRRVPVTIAVSEAVERQPDASGAAH